MPPRVLHNNMMLECCHDVDDNVDDQPKDVINLTTTKKLKKKGMVRDGSWLSYTLKA